WLSDHAQDIAQAALTKVMAAEQRTEGERALTSFYLHRVAHSALVDEIRRRKRRPDIPLEGVTDEGDEGPRFEPVAQGDPESRASSRGVRVAQGRRRRRAGRLRAHLRCATWRAES